MRAFDANNLPCYRSSARLMTDHGEVAIEDLKIGDHVLTLSGAARPLRWIGHRQFDLLCHPAPERVQPIVVRVGAFADGVPSRDLRLFPEHAVSLDEMLIPIRLLINGASIVRDVKTLSVTYYHVELETHDIVLAEALPVETYLDTGNRGMFENSDMPLVLHPDLAAEQARRVAESCQRFVDDTAMVQPHWQTLATRAAVLGYDLPTLIERTNDSGFHIVVNGTAIQPLVRAAYCYTFVLPRTESPIHLVSRFARPCDTRPWIEDRRHLGVMISQIILRNHNYFQHIPLDHPDLTVGWWDVEGDQTASRRWTNGDAVIHLSNDEPAILEITMATHSDYPLQAEAADGTVCAPAENRVCAASQGNRM
jgi:hypothetical protein